MIYNLGKRGRDKITGFEGIIASITTHYVFKSDQYYIVPAIDKEGKTENGQWFSEENIKIIESGEKGSLLPDYNDGKLYDLNGSFRCPKIVYKDGYIRLVLPIRKDVEFEY